MGVEYTGRKVSFGLGKEAVRGTAEAEADYWINHLSLGFYPRAEKVLNESALGNLHKQNDSTTMTLWGEGDFEMKAGDQSIGAILHATMGSVSTGDNADANAAVKDHTFTFDQSNSPASYTFFRKDPNVNEAYALGMVSSLEITAELGAWLMLNGSVITKPATSSSATVARIAETEFKPKHISVKLATNVAGLGAATALASLQSMKLTIDRAVERDLALTTDAPYDISVREIEISGELVLRHSDAVYLNQYLTDVQQALQITVENTDVTIGTAAHPKIVFTLPKVTFDNWELDQGLGDKANQTVSFKGLYDVTTAKALEVVLTNLVASY